MIKKLLSVLVIASVIIASCTKKDNKCPYTDSTVVAPAAEIQTLRDSLLNLGITNIAASPWGFYYTINQTGTGAGVANLCSSITAIYKGNLLNGKTFDSTTAGQAAVFQLGQTILGWQKGVPLISKSGSITLYIPPTLGYGSVPQTDKGNNVVIPANSYLVFNISITNID